MNKRILALIALILILSFFSGCEADTRVDSSITIVATVFPAYDWARELIGEIDGVTLKLLLDKGDMHSYQPTAADIVSVSNCDLFIYIGGGSDAWADDLIKTAGVPAIKTLALSEVEGITLIPNDSHEEHGNDHRHDYECNHTHDEHIWLSLSNAIILSHAISDAICDISPDISATVKSNLASFENELNLLDSEYKTAVWGAAHKEAIFADRFPFIYLTKAYGIRVFSAFPGCSSESDADFETVISLARKLDELSLPAVIVTESSDLSVARAVIDASDSKDTKILILNSMQTISTSDIKNGATYLSLMRSNLGILTEALGGLK